jgi:uncharacterized protein
MKFKASILALAVVFLCATMAGAAQFGFGTSEPGSLTHSTASAIAKLAADQLKMRILLQPHGGQSAFVPAVNAKEVDFGICNAWEMADAVAGIGIYKGQVLSDLRVVSVLMPLRVAFFVAKNSPYKSLRDLKGKKVPGDWTAQKSVGYGADALLANVGMTYADVQMVPVPNVVRGAEDFMAGKVETFYFGVGSGKVMEAGSKVGGLRALPVDTAPDAVARLRKVMTVLYPSLVEPSDANYGILEPAYIAAQDFLLITNKHVPEDVIYQITKVMHGGRAALLSSFKSFGDMFEPKDMAKKLVAGGEYHTGAIQFYKEAGLWPPKEVFQAK